jgi:hypothetical protein
LGGWGARATGTPAGGIREAKPGGSHLRLIPTHARNETKIDFPVGLTPNLQIRYGQLKLDRGGLGGGWQEKREHLLRGKGKRGNPADLI